MTLTFNLEPDELEMFFEEVDEHLQNIDDGVLKLEKGSGIDVLNTTFRAAHTLKALAGTAGHKLMAELTHAMETMFDALREGTLKLNQEMVDQLLQAIDVLKAQREEIATGNPCGIEVDPIIKRLRAMAQPGNAAEVAETPSTPPQPEGIAGPAKLNAEQIKAINKALKEGKQAFNIAVSLADGAFAPGARLLQVSLALQENSEILWQEPSQGDLIKPGVGSTLQLLAITPLKEDEIQRLVNNLPEIKQCTLFVVNPTQEKKTQVPAPAEPAPENAPAPSAAAPAAKPAANTDNGNKLERTIRISVDRLDALMNLVGELVTDRNRLSDIGAQFIDRFGKADAVGMLIDTTDHVDRVVDQLQEEVMRARMLPIDAVFCKFPRMIRDAARDRGKKVNLVIEGQDTELDRSVIEMIGDPLMHLMRNAVDHGVETPDVRTAAGKDPTGTIKLSAAHMEGHIRVVVEDDGKGIDAEKVKRKAVEKGLISADDAASMSDDEAIELIFAPGLSTAEKVTNLSGRGVGMDVVRTNIERLGGLVTVTTKSGKGTVFAVTLPLTLAILQSMLVLLHQDVYAIPISTIVETSRVNLAQISTVKGQETLQWRDGVLPLMNMRQYFMNNRMASRGTANGKDLSMVTVAWGKMTLGLVVDKILGKQEVVVKSLSSIVGDPAGLSGAAILGDGRIALIVDVPGLIKHAVQARKEGVLV